MKKQVTMMACPTMTAYKCYSCNLLIRNWEDHKKVDKHKKTCRANWARMVLTLAEEAQDKLFIDYLIAASLIQGIVMHEGWFISSMLFNSHKALQDTSGIVAWAPAVTGSTEPPTSWHVPFWSKKATVGVHASDMISWQHEQLSAGTPKGGGGRGGGCKGGGGKGGGWLNKAVPLAVAVIAEQHEMALQLAEEVHHHGPNIQKSIKILIYI